MGQLGIELHLFMDTIISLIFTQGTPGQCLRDRGQVQVRGRGRKEGGHQNKGTINPFFKINRKPFYEGEFYNVPILQKKMYFTID